MAKDPAFLFYYQDFLVGTEFMSNQETGCYIRILCHMADKGRLTLSQIKSACRGDGFADDLKGKFQVDEKGLYYNERLEKEVEKRKLYSLSRSENRTYKKKICKSYVPHMENENRNENVIKNEKKINEWFENIWKLYPKAVGKKHAKRHFFATVKTDEDVARINAALNNYRASKTVREGFIKNGSTWFNEWEDWENYKDPEKEETDEDRNRKILAKLSK